LSSVETAR